MSLKGLDKKTKQLLGELAEFGILPVKPKPKKREALG